ncbi:MAG: hypothetical protein M3401_02085, partial [Actinomycetota bacterium]|nr:hypothetical protein [Actinomycetota bacterium]
AAAIVTAGAVEVKHVQTKSPSRAAVVGAAPAAAPTAPEVVASTPQPASEPRKATADKPKDEQRAEDDHVAPAEASTPVTAGTGTAEPTVPGANLTPPQESTGSLVTDVDPGPPEQTGGMAGPAEAAPEIQRPAPPPVTQPTIAADEEAGTVNAVGTGGAAAAP